MCGRYYIAEDDLSDELSRIIDELNRKKTPEGLKTSGEIFPSDIVPVLANSRKQDVQPFAMRWGYAFPNGRPIINARSETAAQKPMFKDGMRQRRCVIPASHYFEWEKRGAARTKYAIRPAHADTLYLAGIYHLENHDGVIVPAFTILTRDATPGIAFIHPRMPVLLPPDATADWLNPNHNAEEVITKPFSIPSVMTRSSGRMDLLPYFAFLSMC
ncbi:MAG: SOS response-associated peptidase [Aristaeellaceae bacterium]